MRASDSATATERATVQAFVEPHATADDYGPLLVPLGTTGLVFAVVAEYSDPDHASIWAVAVFLMTIIAMRDEHFSKLAKQAAELLRPPANR